MNDLREELGKLGDAAVTSLGFIVIEIVVFLVIALIMRAIYCHPPEERDEAFSHSQQHGHGNTVHKWHPLNVYHR